MLCLVRGALAVLLSVVATIAFAQDAATAAGQRQEIVALLTRVQTAFASADAGGLAACWTPKGEFVGPSGDTAEGREGIEKLFKDAFAAHKQAKLLLHVQRFRLVNDGLALVDAVAEVKPSMPTGGTPLASFVIVKQDGRWLIESAHEVTCHLPPQMNHLKDLAWLLGEWSSSTSPAGMSLQSTCDWTANQSFLIRKFKVEGKGTLLHGGTEVIGWDPRNENIRSWVFDSDGGFGETTWVHDGNRWLVKYSGTLSDGSTASATHILTKVDDNTATMQSKDRTVNGCRTAGDPRDDAQKDARGGTRAQGRRRGGTDEEVIAMPSTSSIPQSRLPAGAVVLTATVKSLPGHEAEVRAALLELVAPSRSEQGCLCYNLHETKDEAGLFIFYEQWADQAAFDAHLKTPHFVGLDAKIEGRTEPPVLAFQKLLA